MRTLLGLFSLVFVGTAAANALDSALLESQVSSISGPLGKVGVGIQVLETGERWFFYGDERFPMQSTYKAPIAVAVLHQVDQGALALDQEVIVHRSGQSLRGAQEW